MSKQDRRDAVRADKERPARRGVFSVRCTPTDQVWVSASPNLDGQQNSLFFQLRLGTHRNHALQAAWIEHGESAFAFEVLEELKQENGASDYAVRADLKDLEASWRARLNAPAVF